MKHATARMVVEDRAARRVLYHVEISVPGEGYTVRCRSFPSRERAVAYAERFVAALAHLGPDRVAAPIERIRLDLIDLIDTHTDTVPTDHQGDACTNPSANASVSSTILTHAAPATPTPRSVST